MEEDSSGQRRGLLCPRRAKRKKKFERSIRPCGEKLVNDAGLTRKTSRFALTKGIISETRSWES